MKYVVYNGNRRLRDYNKEQYARDYAYQKLSILLEANGFKLDNVYIDEKLKDGVCIINCIQLPLVIFKIVKEI